MPKLTKREQNAILVLRARLDATHPGHRASREVQAALNGPARLYITTHVLPLLDMLERGETFHGQAEAVERDAAWVRRHMAQAEDAGNWKRREQENAQP